MGGSSGKQKWEPIRQPQGKTAIVTGGNTGIGYEIAKHLALMGCKVILACRSQQRAQAAMLRMQADLIEYKATAEPPFGYNPQELPEELEVEIMPLDLASLKSVVEFADLYRAKGYPLDILVCNAGIGFVNQGYTEDGYELHFQVNYLGHFLLTLHLLPIMRRSETECRIINISSYAHTQGKLDINNIQGKKSYNRAEFYGNSKLFQVMNMFSLVHRLEGTKVTVNSLHPGIIKTEISRNFQDDGLYRRLFNLAGTFGISKSEIVGAAGALNVAVNPQLEGMTGLYYSEGVPATPAQRSRDPKSQEVLWRYSLDCLKDHVTPDLLEDLSFDISELKKKKVPTATLR